MLKKFIIPCIITALVLIGPTAIQSWAQDRSPTPTPTVSPEASPTLVSPTPTVSPEASPTLSPTPTLSPEASPTLVSPTPTLSPEAVSPAPESPLPDASRQEAITPATAEASKIDTGDSAWMLISSALVLLMTPGLAFFYGGLVRSRNVLNTMMMSLILMAVVGVTWILWGYSLAFAPNELTPGANPPYIMSPILGSLKWAFLNGVAFDQPDPIGYAPTIPHQLFMIYQMMFAIITPALISGAIVERVSFKAYFWFIILWSSFIYSPLA
ncbi:MAG: ammonia channel protein, partial [Phormidium sp.]